MNTGFCSELREKMVYGERPQRQGGLWTVFAKARISITRHVAQNFHEDMGFRKLSTEIKKFVHIAATTKYLRRTLSIRCLGRIPETKR